MDYGRPLASADSFDPANFALGGSSKAEPDMLVVAGTFSCPKSSARGCGLSGWAVVLFSDVSLSAFNMLARLLGVKSGWRDKSRLIACSCSNIFRSSDSFCSCAL